MTQEQNNPLSRDEEADKIIEKLKAPPKKTPFFEVTKTTVNAPSRKLNAIWRLEETVDLGTYYDTSLFDDIFKMRK